MRLATVVRLAVFVGLVGCDDGDGGGNMLIGPGGDARVRDAETPDMERPGTDAGAGGMGGIGGMGGGAGGVGGEAGGMGGAGGGMGGAGGGIRDIADCGDACAVYTECGRTADLFPGGEAECLERCGDAEASERLPDYLACMQITRCERLQECVIPPKPLPPCADVCAAIEACDPAYRLPTGLPDVEACAATCDDPVLGRLISQCAGDVLEGTCDEPAFADCILDVRGGACQLECNTRAGCDPEIDTVDCTLECLAAVPPEDPVAARRFQQARDCARNAGSCDELAACDARQARPIVGDATVEDLCAANAECGFLEVEACAEVIDPVLRRLAAGAVDCFTDHFQARCGEPPYACFSPAPVPDGACEEHCLVSDLCDLLPGDQQEFECLERCQAAVASNDPVAIDPFLPFFDCAFLESCEAVSDCQVDAGPQAACRGMCAEQIECGSPGAGACLDTCLETFATDRMKAERACVSVAAGCDNINLCLTPAPPTCSFLCEPLDACRLTTERCEIDCDNGEFADPDAYLPLLACVNQAARCGDRTRCTEGELERGNLCLAWCSARVGCVADAEQTMEECVVECARGEVGGQRGTILESASACLLEAGPDAECPALQACLNDAPFDAYCPAYCAALGRCRLADDLEACAADCRAEQEDPNFFAGAACTLNATRRGESCRSVAECVGAELPPIPRACDELCEAQGRCDEDIDPFLCGLDCDPEAVGLDVRAGCAKHAPCEQLAVCDDAGPDIPVGCNAACGVIAGCEGLVGEGEGAIFEDFAHCTAECAGTSLLLGANFPMNLQGCAQEAMCDPDAIVECFQIPEDLCELGQEAVTACGLDQSPIPGFPPVVPNYLADCQRLQAMDPAAAQEQVQCLQDVAQRAAGGDPFACIEGLVCVGAF